MNRTCHQCGGARHSVSRYCDRCASDLMQRPMREAYRLATIVPRETPEPDAAEIAVGLAKILEAS